MATAAESLPRPSSLLGVFEEAVVVWAGGAGAVAASELASIWAKTVACMEEMSVDPASPPTLAPRPAPETPSEAPDEPVAAAAAGKLVGIDCIKHHGL